jgi:TonB family protein
VDVDANGNVIGVILTGSSGNAALDQAVLETVREQYEFQGVGSGGASIPIEVDMTLEGSDANRAAREQGERREVTVPSAAPVAEDSSPTEAATEVPQASPQAAPTEPLNPSSATDPTPQSPEAASEEPQPTESSPVPSTESSPLLPEETPLPEVAPASPESVLEPEPIPEAIPSEPAYVEPEPVNEAPIDAAPIPSAPQPEVEALPTEPVEE